MLGAGLHRRPCMHTLLPPWRVPHLDPPPQEQQGDTFGVRKLQGKSKWQVGAGSGGSVLSAGTRAAGQGGPFSAAGHGAAPWAPRPCCTLHLLPLVALPSSLPNQIVKMAFTGEAFPYFMATIFTITGAGEEGRGHARAHSLPGPAGGRCALLSCRSESAASNSIPPPTPPPPPPPPPHPTTHHPTTHTHTHTTTTTTLGRPPSPPSSHGDDTRQRVLGGGRRGTSGGRTGVCVCGGKVCDERGAGGDCERSNEPQARRAPAATRQPSVDPTVLPFPATSLRPSPPPPVPNPRWCWPTATRTSRCSGCSTTQPPSRARTAGARWVRRVDGRLTSCTCLLRQKAGSERGSKNERICPTYPRTH